MASATALPLKSIAFSTALVLSIGASRVNLYKLVLRTFGGPGRYSRIIAAIIIIANLKNVPFAWHFRVFNAILKHCLFSIPSIPASTRPSTLFLPVITTSHAPLGECDYNLHKSNSTYFADLDVTRSHLICALLQPGLDKLNHNPREKLVLGKEGQVVKGARGIMLGGVMCSFKREIGMYEGYEIWTRILSWDRKWIYIITHFVKKGTVKPSAYILADGSWFGKGYRPVKGQYDKGREVDEKAIFASAIGKYVVKLGRLTVHPEVLLGASGVLPPRPGGWHSMVGGRGDETPEDGEVEIVQTNDTQSTSGAGEEEWDWKRIEAEKEKGMKYVESFAALDGLHQEFSGSSGPALGKFRDFLL